MTVSDRPFVGDDDLGAMLALVGEAARFAGPVGNMHLGDVLWRRFMLDDELVEPRRNVRLWEEAGELVGFAWFSPPDSIETQTRPGRDLDLLGPMLDWAEERQADLIRDGQEAQELVADAYEGQRERIALLEARGFRRDEAASYLLNHRSLEELGASVPLPPGIVIRPVDGADERELTARVELHREVWHPSRVTESAYRRLRAAPGYRPDLDLVAVAPDGALAAYCICWFNPVSRTGEFEPVGTRPAYRGQGYGRAVVTEGLHRLRALGARSAIVFSYGSSEPANRLYAACGFRELARTNLYRRPIAPVPRSGPGS